MQKFSVSKIAMTSISCFLTTVFWLWVLFVGWAAFQLASSLYESAFNTSIASGDRPLHSNTLAKLDKIEREILPLLKEKKITSFSNDAVFGCNEITIEKQEYSTYFPGDCFGNGREIPDKATFNKTSNFDIIDIEVSESNYKNEELDITEIEITFSNYLQNDTIFYIPDQSLIEKRNQFAQENEQKNPEQVLILHKSIKRNWYKQVRID